MQNTSLTRKLISALAALLLSAGFASAAERLDSWMVQDSNASSIVTWDNGTTGTPLPIPPCMGGPDDQNQP